MITNEKDTYFSISSKGSFICIIPDRIVHTMTLLHQKTKRLEYFEGRKEMFYLMTHSTHFIYGYLVSDVVNDLSDSERGNPLPPHGLLFPNSNKFLLYAPSRKEDSTYHSLCYTSREALAGTRNSSIVQR